MTEPLDLAWTPEVCALPTSERPIRIAEFDDLLARSLRSQERLAPTRLRWRLDRVSEATARDLAAREASCCSFFGFSFALGEDLAVDVEVPASQVDVLDALEWRAASCLGRTGGNSEVPQDEG